MHGILSEIGIIMVFSAVVYGIKKGYDYVYFKNLPNFRHK
jgi:hypothetical protein